MGATQNPPVPPATEQPSFTPGPWTVEDHTEVIARVPSPSPTKAASDVLTVCRCVDVEIYHDDRSGKTDANARLIAAAPDLYAALLAIAEGIERDLRLSVDPNHPICRDTLANRAAAARAALAKAGVA
jgi:hypothetical protein